MINQDSGYLVINLANDLAKKGVKVSIMAGRVVPRQEPLFDEVKVSKIIKYNRSNRFLRILTWLVGFIQIIIKVRLRYRKATLLIYTNPPLSTFLPAFCKNRYSLMIFDLYPDILIKMNFLRESSGIVRYWSSFNRRSFKGAEKVFTLSESMSEQIKDYTEKPPEIIPLWSEGVKPTKIIGENNPFARQHGLDKRFVVIYSGNLGATHNTGIFTEVAAKVTNPNVVFLIIGEGDQKESLELDIKERKLENIILLPLQPVESINLTFNSGDIALISQNPNASGLSVPSKTFSFMALGKPLICISGEESELKRLIDKYNNGKFFYPDDIDLIAQFIDTVSKDRELISNYGKCSGKASEDFSRKNAQNMADLFLNQEHAGIE